MHAHADTSLLLVSCCPSCSRAMPATSPPRPALTCASHAAWGRTQTRPGLQAVPPALLVTFRTAMAVSVLCRGRRTPWLCCAVRRDGSVDLWQLGAACMDDRPAISAPRLAELTLLPRALLVRSPQLPGRAHRILCRHCGCCSIHPMVSGRQTRRSPAGNSASPATPTCFPPSHFRSSRQPPHSCSTAGTYAASEGQASCTPCPAGSINTRSGMDSCQPCDPGFYASSTTKCSPASAGYFVRSSGAASQTPW